MVRVDLTAECDGPGSAWTWSVHGGGGILYYQLDGGIGAAMATAEKVSVTLTPEMVRDVRASVDSGEYASASEVVREALRGWQRQRAEDAERLASVRARARRSLDDPRPSLTEAELDRELAAFYADVAGLDDDAGA